MATTTPVTEPHPAILSSGPSDPSTWRPGNNWTHTTIHVPVSPLAPGDILVEMAASGICHTDFTVTSPHFSTSPRVVGHEGAGYVRAIGEGVTKDLRVGDPVLLSFDSCGGCESCAAKHPAYCAKFMPLNIMGTPNVFTSASEGGEGIAGKCFGQSSFAALSVVKEASVLNARDLVKSKEELMLFAPLGCGIMTGMGAVLNMAKPGPGARVLVAGLGGVGLSAIAAAAICGCSQIIAVDILDTRIELAKSMGATHGLNTSGVEDFEAAFKEITNGLGPTVVIDTTSHLPLLQAALNSLSYLGTLIPVGAPKSDPAAYNVTYSIHGNMTKGTRVLGCIEGDSVPGEFIPELVRYYREGKLPLERMVKFYEAADFKTALHDMHSGETIKPVLKW